IERNYSFPDWFAGQKIRTLRAAAFGQTPVSYETACIGVETTTRDSYALIMERIWRAHPPANGRIKTQQHLSTLDADVNDIWIAAVALEHGLILLTEDRMEAIRTCVPEITIENWLV
ncbi:MAG TPA: hypothetical protein VLM42_08235, partial [Bryobacteraceae bacterium]|nr:hypothetical protein [Bryobacteraceae bacterium]